MYSNRDAHFLLGARGDLRVGSVHEPHARIAPFPVGTPIAELVTSVRDARLPVAAHGPSHTRVGAQRAHLARVRPPHSHVRYYWLLSTPTVSKGACPHVSVTIFICIG